MNDVKPGVRLCYETGATEIKSSARALAFGMLAELAVPYVKRYMSDLYHDVHWVSDFLIGSDVTFFYGVRESGTSIGLDESAIVEFNERAWRARVWVDGGTTRMELTPIK